jgi:hypothetical protein
MVLQQNQVERVVVEMVGFRVLTLMLLQELQIQVEVEVVDLVVLEVVLVKRLQREEKE